jgi:hypothetical protein
MNEPFVLGIAFAFVAGVIKWGQGIEKRLSAVEALMPKLDKLVDLLLQQELNNR